MKRVFALFFWVLVCCWSSAQQPDTVDLSRAIDLPVKNKIRDVPVNSLYLELAGHLNFVSLNYERLFYYKKEVYLTWRIGAGYIPPSVNTISLPFLVNGIYHVSRGFFLELGMGLDLTYTFWTDQHGSDAQLYGTTFYAAGAFADLLLTGCAGIRIQSRNGFLLRLDFTPLVELNDNAGTRTIYMQTGSGKRFLPWVGVSLGYSFR